MADHYQVLGITRQADKQVIKSAYKKLAIRYHPDKNPENPAAEEQFKLINEAYQVLSDEDKKSFYDLQLQDVRRHLAPHPQAYQPFRPFDRENYRRFAAARARYQAQQQHARKHLTKVYALSAVGLLAFWALILTLVFYWRHHLAQQHYAEGLAFVKQKNFYEALYAFNNALAQDDRFASVYFSKAAIFIDFRKNYQEALSNISEGEKYQKGTLPPEVLLRRGVCHYFLHQYEKALPDFDSLATVKPVVGEALFYRGSIRWHNNLPNYACSDWIEAYKAGYDASLDSLTFHCSRK